MAEFLELFENNIDFLQKEIECFFKENIEDGNFFHPHDLTWESLKNIILTKSKDSYVIMIVDAHIAGYGLLRGWDEGYEIPSLGIMISKDYRGKGLASAMMEELHRIARQKNSKKVRLTVLKENLTAISLYKKLGYKLEDLNKQNLIGFKNL